MAKDTRVVNYGIRTLVDEKNRKARVLGANTETIDADLDEIAGMYSQAELDQMIVDGVLGGEWVSGKQSASSAFPSDYPGFEVLGQVEGMTPEKIAEMSDEDVLAIKGIGKKTLEDIRAYK